MPTTFQKLNLKDQKEILVLNAPESFEGELKTLQDISIKRSLAEIEEIVYALIFVVQKSEIDNYTEQIKSRVCGDAIVWFVYPKGTSKKYKADFNRDFGWCALKDAGYQPVRMVAIDDDWSALRFRHSSYVKR